MTKSIFIKTFFATILVLSSNLYGQTPKFTWKSGGSKRNDIQISSYGTKGVSSETNLPGARSRGKTWTDSNGNLWLYGGLGNSFVDPSPLNDLWKYNIASGQWVWMHGSKDAKTSYQGGIDTVIYGTKKISSPLNTPGDRRSSISWIDSNDNLWLYGGLTYFGTPRGVVSGYSNDFWRYEISKNEWTWMFGSDPSTSVLFEPYPREPNVGWVDSEGNFYLFGGYSYTSNEYFYLNDLWKFDPKNEKWNFISGSSLADQKGRYGQKGIPSMNNFPGGRSGSVSWRDNEGNLWLFGGGGYAKDNKQFFFNDLWRYNIKKNEWTWISGADTLNSQGITNTSLGIPSTSNSPSAREHAVCWTDSSGNLWLFGGRGYHKNVTYAQRLNDLWRYDIKRNEWIWVAGSVTKEQNGIYGTKGIPSVSNIPGSREYSQSWTDKQGNLWLLGGAGYDSGPDIFQIFLNDLWQINTCLSVPKPVFNLSDFNFCNGDSLKVSVINTNKGDTLKWFWGGKSDLTNITSKIFTESSKLYVTRTDSLGCTSISDTIQIMKKNLPASPIITRDASSNLASNIGNIIWYKDGLKLTDTTQKLKPLSNGIYTATTTQNGCVSLQSQGYYYLINGEVNFVNGDFFKVSPNPTDEYLIINFKLGHNIGVFISIIDMSGKVVSNGRKVLTGEKLNISKLSKGNYLVQARTVDGKILTQSKIIKN